MLFILLIYTPIYCEIISNATLIVYPVQVKKDVLKLISEHQMTIHK